ncbi:Ubiquitin-conjugating enzyme E2 27 [Hondaea fermentalgiana]|uniref:E2 ubiquitin-conjugating enzyme n=1 Tax=Hondaea fermentalgiana TaxID=2315210 RepID=A0A2R5GCX0_9STRA|nr:Ubiquitin-conjugating enzyme E2 27 [Hondaea fermentalgiana]|eukprot:GBG28817.1 Ubiquitin-conjugating enzyme E2 27 [Hondaea fermentalgiana]
MPTDRRRVKRELEECAKDEELTGVSVRLVNDGDYTHLTGKIKGPSGTCYEGGIFSVDIEIPESYPFEPPKMRFITKIWHPNVSSQTGAICLDILKDQWSPALTIKTALVSLQALLSAPEPTDPQDAQVARQYLDEPETFQRTAEFWTNTYATEATEDEVVKRICDMGFPEDRVVAALRETNGDEEAALEKLLSEA